eukprot:Em0054g34a
MDLQDEEITRRRSRECPGGENESHMALAAGGNLEEHEETEENEDPDEIGRQRPPDDVTASAGPRDDVTATAAATTRASGHVVDYPIIHPSQTRFACPEATCRLTYPSHASLVRHVGVSHKRLTLNISFKCAQCEYTHENKRSTSLHFRHAHGVAVPPAPVTAGNTSNRRRASSTSPSSSPSPPPRAPPHRMAQPVRPSTTRVSKRPARGRLPATAALPSPSQSSTSPSGTQIAARSPTPASPTGPEVGVAGQSPLTDIASTAVQSAIDSPHSAPRPSPEKEERTPSPPPVPLSKVGTAKVQRLDQLLRALRTRTSVDSTPPPMDMAIRIPENRDEQPLPPTPSTAPPMALPLALDTERQRLSQGEGVDLLMLTSPSSPEETPVPPPAPSVFQSLLHVPPFIPAAEWASTMVQRLDQALQSMRGGEAPDTSPLTTPPSSPRHAQPPATVSARQHCSLGVGMDPSQLRTTLPAVEGSTRPPPPSSPSQPRVAGVSGPLARITIDPENMDQTLRLPFHNELLPFANRTLGEFEWVAFEGTLERWSTAIKEVVTAQSHHPSQATSRWARRRRRQTENLSQQCSPSPASAPLEEPSQSSERQDQNAPNNRASGRARHAARARIVPTLGHACGNCWTMDLQSTTDIQVSLGCLEPLMRVMSSGLHSTVTLIHKGGDTANIRNWRPISLQLTVYKLYSAIIARRIASWAIECSAFSPAQKGFLAFDGCAEHNFLLRSILTDSRRSKNNVLLTWLDLQEAFPSVSHELMLLVMGRLGLSGSVLQIVSDIYTNSTMSRLGGMGIPCAEDESHVVRAAQAFKFLGDTRDPRIRDVALHQLGETMRMVRDRPSWTGSPDLTIISPDESSILLVEVSCPFEGSPTALEDAARSKTENSPASTISNTAPSPSTTELDSTDCDRFVASLTRHRAQSTLLNRADDLIAALRVPILPLPARTDEHLEDTMDPSQSADQHTPVTSKQIPARSRETENRPSLQTTVEPVYERLRLDFTEKDFNRNNLDTTITTTATTDYTTPTTSQAIREVISDIRRAVEEEDEAIPQQQQQQQQQQDEGELGSRDKINTLFQTGLLRLTESPLLNDDEWKTFCNKLDELTRTIAQLCDKDRLQGRRDNNNRNGQRGYRQREASQPGRRPNRINGRERRIREMVDIQKLYRKNPKQAMQQIKQEPPPLRCQIPCQTVQNHFEELGRPTPDFDNPGPPPFGSWPTTTTGDVLMEMLCQTGVGPHTRDIIRDIYTNSTMCVRTADEMTAPIQCNKGVKQGCPLSPILFNLVMEPLIRAVDTIHSAGSARQFAETFSPTLNDELIPAMKWEDHYKYLGCKVGGDYKAEATAQGKEYIKSSRAIFESGLTDWQKLDAVHRFAKPGLIYIMQNTLPNKSWAQQIDKEVRNMAKRAFKLNDTTREAFVIDVTVPFEGPNGFLFHSDPSPFPLLPVESSFPSPRCFDQTDSLTGK